MSDVKTVNGAEQAKYIRAALKTAFPGVKFSVVASRFSQGSAVDISWVDGPLQSEVDGALINYQGRSYQNGGTVYAEPITIKGETVRFTSWVSTARKYSLEFLTKVAQQWAQENGQPVPAVSFNGTFANVVDFNVQFENEFITVLVRRLADVTK